MVKPGRRIRLRHIALVLAILVAVTPLIAGHLGQPAIGANSVVPGVGLADIAVGQPIAEILSRFGTPTAVRLTGAGGLLGYGFDKYGITVYAHGDVVQAVATTNSVISSANGISLGTPLGDIVKAMGADYSAATIEGFPGIVYRDAGIAFGLDRNSVASILVFRASAAAPARPAAPTGRTSPFVDPYASTPGSAVATATTAATGPDSTAPAPATFDVNQLRPFTAGARFLSLHGYLRMLMHSSSNTWMSAQDTDRLIHDGNDSELH
jgi:hypothetical protein